MLAAGAIVQELHVEEASAALAECENQDEIPKSSTIARMVSKNTGTGVAV